jgi:hypothetical protein
MPSPAKILRLLFTGFIAGGSAAAWAAEGSITVSPGVVSGYIFRGQDRGGAALQTAVDMARGDFGAGLWTSFPLDGSGALSPGTEVDLYVVQNLRVGGTFVVTPGATLYSYPRADRALGFRRTTLEPNLAISGAVAGVRVTPRLSHDLDLEATTLEVAAVYALALPSLGTELDFNGAAGTYLRRNDVPAVAGAVKSWGNYWQVGVSLPYQVSFRIKLVLGWTYAVGSGAFLKSGSAPRLADPRAASRGFASLGFATTF